MKDKVNENHYLENRSLKNIGRKKDIKLDDSKKILVICQYYYPENFQITPICEQLVDDGYKVTVLTGLPNYPTGVIPDEYKQGHRDEYINGVHVIRCSEIPRKKGIVGLAMNYISYPISAVKKIRKIKDKFDIVFVYQLSPILMAIPGVRYAKKNNLPLFLYCCDLWPESMKMYIKNESNPIFKLINMISYRIYNAADLVMGQSLSFLPYLSEKHKLSEKKMVYIPGFADDTYLKTNFVLDNGIVDFVFLGNLGIAQNLIAVLSAIKKIENLPGFRVHFVGDGSCLNQMRKYVKINKLDKIVKFYGRRPVEEMTKFYRLADACVVSLKAEDATGLTLPTKVQGYMAAGKPIIGMIDGSAKNVIESARCGICVGAGDVEGFALAMKTFIENPERFVYYGKNGRKYFQENFAKKIVINKIENEIEKLFEKRR